MGAREGHGASLFLSRSPFFLLLAPFPFFAVPSADSLVLFPSLSSPFCVRPLSQALDGVTTPSHIICADGAIHTIPAGGKAVVRVLDEGSEGGGRVRVWR